MDLIYTLVKTFGFLLSLGVMAIIPVLYVLAILKRLPWLLAAPAMALVAAIAVYPAGMLEGIKKERAGWEIKVHNLRAAMQVKKAQAERAGAAIEAKYLQSESDKDKVRRQRDDMLKQLILIDKTPESKSNEPAICPVCRPYSMRVSPDILRNIKKR